MSRLPAFMLAGAEPALLTDPNVIDGEYAEVAQSPKLAIAFGTAAETDPIAEIRRQGGTVSRIWVDGMDQPRLRPAFVEGLFPEMPSEQYFATEAMSASGAKNILRSPYHYRFFRDRPDEPTAAMQFGTAVHTGVLEPETFDSKIVGAPELDKRSKAGKEAWLEFKESHSGFVILDADDFDRARRCIDAVRAHPGAMQLLTGAECEASAMWMDFKYRVPCKMRYDARNHGGMIDLKTTPDACDDEFHRKIANFKYHMQAAAYCSGSEHLWNTSPEFFVFIAVESMEPHGVACYELPGNGILAGAHLWNLALGRYRDCRASHKWPSYPDTIQSIALPRWALSFDS